MIGHCHRRGNNCFSTLTVLLVLAAVLILFPASVASAKDSEEASVLQAARHFLDAEQRGDHRAVYDCFAPSSPYVRNHSFEDYVREAQSSEDRLESFTIVEVTYIQENDDLESWPSVTKFAQVEVEVVFIHLPTDRRSEINVGFIFFKEGDRWYKS